jgi:hypothetical protein
MPPKKQNKKKEATTNGGDTDGMVANPNLATANPPQGISGFVWFYNGYIGLTIIVNQVATEAERSGMRWPSIIQLGLGDNRLS